MRESLCSDSKLERRLMNTSRLPCTISPLTSGEMSKRRKAEDIFSTMLPPSEKFPIVWVKRVGCVTVIVMRQQAHVPLLPAGLFKSH